MASIEEQVTKLYRDYHRGLGAGDEVDEWTLAFQGDHVRYDHEEHVFLVEHPQPSDGYATVVAVTAFGEVALVYAVFDGQPEVVYAKDYSVDWSKLG